MNNEKLCVGEARQCLPQKVDETNKLMEECVSIAGNILLTLKQKEKIGSPGKKPECFFEALDLTQLSVKLLHDELTEIAYAFGCE